jgi:hypothetical protein
MTSSSFAFGRSSAAKYTRRPYGARNERGHLNIVDINASYKCISCYYAKLVDLDTHSFADTNLPFANLIPLNIRPTTAQNQEVCVPAFP